MGTYELEKRVSRLESKWNRICCYIRSCIGISSTTGDPDLVLNQQGDWVAGGGGSYYLYSENYDAGSFTPQAATGLNSIAMGGAGAVASGNYSLAFGAGAVASEDFSISFGNENLSSGKISTSFGNKTVSSGDLSTTFGNESEASGWLGFACGNKVFAPSYGEIGFGLGTTIYTPLSNTSAEETDRLFNVGNGDNSLAQPNSDAFTILKNGKCGIDIDNFETTISDAKLQVNGYINAKLNAYANHAAAAADTALKSDDFYKLIGDRTLYQKF
jgi:hypothetical protein